MNPWVDLAISFGRAFLIWMIPLSMIPLMIWFERKVSAYIADRTGPNRAHIAGVRMAGFVHNFADVLKLVMKEDIVPANVHKIPMQALRLNIGVLWVFAIASFGVLGIIFAGYGANSKYSILGGLRASAQMISYELSLSLSILGLIMVFGTLDLNSIAQQQGALLFGFLPWSSWWCSWAESPGSRLIPSPATRPTSPPPSSSS